LPSLALTRLCRSTNGWQELARHTILDLARKMYRKAPDTFTIEVKQWINDRRSKA
jgi:hypothetical protein